MKILVALVSCALVLGACSSSSKQSSPPTTGAPATTASTASTTTTVPTGPRSIGHVFVINLENEDYATSFGKASPAHYLNGTLLPKGKLLTQYHGIGHASLDNYIAEISGQAPNPETQADCVKYIEFTSSSPGNATGKYQQALGKGCVYPKSVKTVADQLTAAGKTWRGYMDDMGTPCRHPAIGANDTTIVPKPGDMYATRHNPFVYFHSILDTAACKTNVVDYTALATDLQSADTTPNLAFITPNVCHDGHDAPCVDGKPGGLVSADLWLTTEVPKILASPAYKADGMLIITFDEAEITDGSACCHTPPDPNSATPGLSGPGGGRIGTLVISSRVQAGTTDATPYNHYALLCSIEDVFGLAHLGFAGAPGLACFGDDVYDVTS
jgi:phosphatidylinositol-3-phosphatase